MLILLTRGIIAAGLLLLVQSPSLQFDQAGNAFRLENWPNTAGLSAEQYSELLSVSVDAVDAVDAVDVPPLLGRYEVRGGVLVFIPQFPLQPGMRYRATARVPGAAPVTLVVNIPKPDVAATTHVSTVFPTTDTLSENHLKFYVHFSGSMSRGFAYDHVRLLDESGSAVNVPFLELGEELWDPEVRRFTLFFDPGRIKRGLVSQQELGVALQEGKRYTLVIDKGWRDAQGNPLLEEFRKTFTVGPADRTPVDLKTWKVRKPQSGTRNPLAVEFIESMDHAILTRELDVVDAAGGVITGSVEIGPLEKSWLFIPDSPWKAGGYSILVGTSIADLAGNMVDRPFEIDVFDRVDNLERQTRTISFAVD